jgi:hypothetical protein
MKTKAALVSETAGTRSTDLEINLLVFDVVVTTDPPRRGHQLPWRVAGAAGVHD